MVGARCRWCIGGGIFFNETHTEAHKLFTMEWGWGLGFGREEGTFMMRWVRSKEIDRERGRVFVISTRFTIDK